MDWSKAKRVAIFILVIVNIILLGLNYKKDREYELTAAQEKAVFSIMAANGINIYTELVSNYAPMSSINVSIPEINPEIFLKIFFKDDDVKTSLDYNKVIYKSGLKTLIIAGNSISFTDDSADTKDILEEDAKRISDSLMKSVGIKTTGNYDLSNSSKLENSYSFEYFLEFKKFKIFSSKAKVEVSASGIKSFSASFFNIDSQLENKKDICSCDEALLTFMYEVKKRNIEGNIFIRNIELGYDFQNTGEIAEGRNLKLVPCYYIYVANEENPYIIDAYENEMKLG